MGSEFGDIRIQRKHSRIHKYEQDQQPAKHARNHTYFPMLVGYCGRGKTSQGKVSGAADAISSSNWLSLASPCAAEAAGCSRQEVGDGMRLAAWKHPFFLAKHQPIITAGARLAAAAVADPCSWQAKKGHSCGAWRWRVAVASSDAEADGGGGGGGEDGEAGKRGTGPPPRRRARLSARRRESVRLPDGVSGDGIGAFLRDPAGVESLLNTGALQSFEPAWSGPGTFTCTLRRIRLLGFEVAPVLNLRVVPTATDCTVEMLSCRFEGSESVEQQNEFFSAFMRNHITWNNYCDEPCIDIDVNLEITLEVYTKPFSLLPLSAVEKPGNLLMQGLLDRLVPRLGEQLLRDYHSWANQQLEASS